MKAELLLKRRFVLSESAFAEIVIWRLPTPLKGSTHDFKYRLAYVTNGKCIVRYDNESGKGNHIHVDDLEQEYEFTTPEQLLKDFFAHIKRFEEQP